MTVAGWRRCASREELAVAWNVVEAETAERATDTFGQLAERYPKDAVALMNFGHLLRFVGAAAAAEEVAGQVSRLRRVDQFTRISLSRLWRDLGQGDRSLAVLSDVSLRDDRRARRSRVPAEWTFAGTGIGSSSSPALMLAQIEELHRREPASLSIENELQRVRHFPSETISPVGGTDADVALGDGTAVQIRPGDPWRTAIAAEVVRGVLVARTHPEMYRYAIMLGAPLAFRGYRCGWLLAVPASGAAAAVGQEELYLLALAQEVADGSVEAIDERTGLFTGAMSVGDAPDAP